MAIMRERRRERTNKKTTCSHGKTTDQQKTNIHLELERRWSNQPQPHTQSSARMEQNTQEQPTDTHSFGASNPMVKSATSPLLPRQTLASSASPDETGSGSKTHHQVNRSVQDRRMDAKCSGSLAKLASLVRVTSDVTMESFFCFD